MHVENLLYFVDNTFNRCSGIQHSSVFSPSDYCFCWIHKNMKCILLIIMFREESMEILENSFYLMPKILLNTHQMVPNKYTKNNGS